MYLKLTFFTVDDLNNRTWPITLRDRFNICPLLPVPANTRLCLFSVSKKHKMLLKPLHTQIYVHQQHLVPNGHYIIVYNIDPHINK